jgi:cytoskeleton protein RodZ
MTETQAAGLGAELRAARQAQGWELPQLAASLRIRQSYLEAIEAGRVADLPGTTYALGFVRAYATALGLPGEEMARRFRADATLANGQPALRFPAPVPQRGVPAGALMLLGVVILAGAYGGWYWVTEHRATPVEMVPPIPDRMVTETQKPLPSPAVASLLPATAAPAASPPPAPAAASGNQTPPQTATAPPPQAAQTAPAAKGAVIPPPAEAVSTPPPPPPATPVNVPAGSRLVIRATADAWVTVKQKSGPALLNKLMHAGESWPVPATAAGLTLTTGNAGGTAIDVDGTPITASLGGSGAVRRDLPLDAEMLKSGKLPPPPARSRPKAAPDAAGGLE